MYVQFLQGLTALMCATLAEHVKVVKELLLAKADPTLRKKVCHCTYHDHFSTLGVRH